MSLLKHTVVFARLGTYFSNGFLSLAPLGESCAIWAPLGPPGPLRISVDICGPLWTSVDLCGPPLDLCGPLWTSVDLCGPLWTSVDLCGPWTSGHLRGPLVASEPRTPIAKDSKPGPQAPKSYLLEPSLAALLGRRFCLDVSANTNCLLSLNTFLVFRFVRPDFPELHFGTPMPKHKFGRPPWPPSPGASFCLDVSRKTQISCSGG
jgi:hypothetical protein